MLARHILMVLLFLSIHVRSSHALPADTSPRFGSRGQWSPAGSLSVTYNPPGWVSVAMTPQIGYFIRDRILIGASLALAYSHYGERSQAFSVTFGPIGGYYIPFSTRCGLLPHVMFGYTRIGLSFGHNQITAAVHTPLVVHLSSHFYVGVGPSFSASLLQPARVDAVALTSTFGGWF